MLFERAVLGNFFYPQIPQTGADLFWGFVWWSDFAGGVG